MVVTLGDGVLVAVLSFVVLLIGTYVSSGVFTDGFDLGYAALSAAITSLVWSGVTYLISGVIGISGIVLALGPVLAVIAYIVVTDVLYEGSLLRATAISAGTWVVTFVILYVVTSYTTYSALEAIGVPPGL